MIELIGKNGSGKTYISKELCKLGFERHIGYTTREKRIDEVDGVDYHFITKEEFEDKIKQGFFIEYKKRGDNYYGISFEGLKDTSILVGGNARLIEEYTSNPIYKVYIDSSLAVRFDRVSNRKESIVQTFDRFHQENFSYLENFFAIFIDNNLEQGIDEFISRIGIDGKIKDNSYIMSNVEFLKKKINIFESPTILEPTLEDYLLYEEYFLRQMFINGNVSKKEYLERMKNFFINYGYKFKKNENGFYLDIDDKVYDVDYKEGRIKIR